MINNMDGVCASKKSWLFKAYVQNVVNGYARMDSLGPCRSTKEEAETDQAKYDGVCKTWVEQVPARFAWRD